MNVYNEAHNLAAALKECDEFMVYNDLKEKINANPELNKALNDFQFQQIQLQMKQMQGQEMGEEDINNIQQLYGILMRDPLAGEYLQAEMRFSMMMNDVYKIIGDAIGTNMPNMEDVKAE